MDSSSHPELRVTVVTRVTSGNRSTGGLGNNGVSRSTPGESFGIPGSGITANPDSLYHPEIWVPRINQQSSRIHPDLRGSRVNRNCGFTKAPGTPVSRIHSVGSGFPESMKIYGFPCKPGFPGESGNTKFLVTSGILISGWHREPKFQAIPRTRSPGDSGDREFRFPYLDFQVTSGNDI